MRPKILIVDDVLENLHVLSETLAQKNYEIRCAKNGQLALLGAQVFLPDLVLLDVKMPDMDGYEVCRRLKADQSTSHIPVIFMSALSDVSDKVQAFAQGGADYITKPFQVEEVLARIRHQIDLQIAQQEIIRLNAELEERVRQRTAQLEAANSELQREINGRKRVETQLVHDAFHDTLTQLPNRSLLMQRIRMAMERSQSCTNYKFALLFIDLDRFKVVNDSLGHVLGDELLVAIAGLLKDSVRPTDVVARLGGDEFTILLEGIASLTDAVRVAERVQSSLICPLEIHGHTIFTSASIGIVLGHSKYQKPTELLRNADIAMYRAKSQGKACYVIFDQQMYEETMETLQIENDLRQARERDELFIQYQPIISLITGELIGLEALLRWQHGQRGMISPEIFIPIAEETGQIIPIGNWVLQQACTQLSRWQKRFPYAQNIDLHVNLASSQLKDPNFLSQVDQVLCNCGLEGHHLHLEITETTLVAHTEKTISLLHQLQQRSIHLSIDDFGQGYSSLSYLHRFPVNSLKIDRSFIHSMTVDAENYEIVRTVITLAHILQLDVIAEGVETVEQLTHLKQLGCEAAQGYLFAKPLNVEAVENLLAKPHNWMSTKLLSPLCQTLQELN